MFFKKLMGKDKPAAPTAATTLESVLVQTKVGGNSSARFKDDYELGPVLGKGAFSTVHLATRKDTKERFATKVVSRRRLPKVCMILLFISKHCCSLVIKYC
jgi:serine/threonine protein kinase